MQREISDNSQIWTIVGCGESARNWQQIGHSLGVNDAAKWGKPLDSLLVCNRPQTFSPDRLKIIKESNPKDFYSHKANWSQYFPNWKKINLVTWYGSLNPGQVYSSDSSPFIAISLAYTLGAKEIILWGCDFKNHHVFNEGNPGTKREVQTYLQLFAALKEKGCEVYLGNTGTAFDYLIPKYENKAVCNSVVS